MRQKLDDLFADPNSGAADFVERRIKLGEVESNISYGEGMLANRENDPNYQDAFLHLATERTMAEVMAQEIQTLQPKFNFVG